MSVNEQNWGPVPSGSIIAWYARAPHPEGSEPVTIPPPVGWYICDGNNDTPDLTERFILGTNKYVKVGDKGGADTHTHDAETDVADKKCKHGLAGGSTENYVAHLNHHHKLQMESAENLPPYMYLIYIMKR